MAFRYSEDRVGPWKLYIYGQDGFHSGGQWFARDIKYPDEEIGVFAAYVRYREAFDSGLEIRICDGGDQLVHHAKDRRIIYGPQFWDDVRAIP